MSDYISIKDDRFWQILFDEACVEGEQAERIQKELEQISVDEKEIIRNPFEKVVERLKDARMPYCREFNSYNNGIEEAIKIFKEECGISE